MKWRIILLRQKGADPQDHGKPLRTTSVGPQINEAPKIYEILAPQMNQTFLVVIWGL